MPEFFVHDRGLCESDDVGAGTRIWAFAHVLQGARIGLDCNICDGVFVEGGAVVGDRVTVKCGVQLWNGITLEDDVFVGPNATFTNDAFPRSRRWLSEYPATVVRRKASVGANATILPGLQIGVGAMVGAGAVVTRSVPPYAVVTGNPAQITGYARQSDQPRVTVREPSLAGHSAETLGVGGVRLHRLAQFGDLRGKLAVGLFGDDAAIPFTPARWFLVYDVPTREVRGEHAHRTCHQFLLCLAGSVTVAVDDGVRRAELALSDRGVGIYIPPLVWATQYGYDAEAALLVFASHEYDPSDYIREYDMFLDEVGVHADDHRSR